MNHVSKLNPSQSTPFSALHAALEDVADIDSVVIAVTWKDKRVTTSWSQQPKQQLLYATEALRRDVLKDCFGD